LKPSGSGKAYTLCGTSEYLAPEMILGNGYNKAVDWWALGIVLYEMIVGSTPFLIPGLVRKQQDQIKVFESIVSNEVTYPVGMEEDCKDLLESLLCKKTTSRMGCGIRAHKDFERHTWFDDIDFTLLKARRIMPPWIPPLEGNTDKSLFEMSKLKSSSSPKSK